MNFIFALLILVATSAQAEKSPDAQTGQDTKKETESLKEKALKEIEKTQNKPGSSSQKNIHFLKLELPADGALINTTRYWVGVKLQSFQAEGYVPLGSVGGIQLSSTPTSLMPSLEFGFQDPLDSNIPLYLGWIGEFGLSSQVIPITLKNGVTVSDPTLRSLLASTGLYLSWIPEGYQNFELFISPRLGLLSYNQSSANEVVSFSEQISFHQLAVGAHYHLTHQTHITALYNQKSPNSNTNNTVNIQHRNAQLGVRYLW